MKRSTPRDKSSWERCTFRSIDSGRFCPTGEPKPLRVKVDLPANVLEALDAYAAEQRIGRGKALAQLLPKLLSIPSPPAQPRQISGIERQHVRLIQCRLTDPAYKWIRDRHYVPNNGAVGQSIHYLVHYRDDVVGVISGASAVWSTKPRDDFYGLSDEQTLRAAQLTGIINNSVFRLEHPAPNLASLVLAMWRKQVARDWEQLYGVKVAGFETFVIQQNLLDGRCRDGTCYRADNWECVGITAGSTKKAHGVERKHGREETVRKLVYCKRVKGVALPDQYESTWRDKERSAELGRKRRGMLPTPLETLLGRSFAE